MAGAQTGADLWVNEYISPWDIYQHGVQKLIAHKTTEFQDMYIVLSGNYGKGLVLDGKWQSSTVDEFLYHEPLVHPAMIYHGSAKRVLVLGGGEGATVREVLRWNCVENVTMVDIDGEVVDACKEHLEEMHQGAFDDPRTVLVIGDAIKQIEDTSETWDIIISDLSDPIEEGPSFPLFTKEYFEKAKAVLNPGGILVVQAGPVSPPEVSTHARLASTLKSVFKHVHSYATYTSSYGSPWGFLICTEEALDTRPDPAAIDKRLAAETKGGFKLIDGMGFLGMMQTPLYIRRQIEQETEVFTLAAPPKFFGKGVAAGS